MARVNQVERSVDVASNRRLWFETLALFRIELYLFQTHVDFFRQIQLYLNRLMLVYRLHYT